ncbi:Protein PS1 [Bienertia sinuspersici]
MAIAIANRMGTFVELDCSNPLGYMRVMRFRVGGVQKWVEVKYEKLLDFCYLCDLFGQSTKDCGLYDEDIPELICPYGSWLRASPTRNKFRGESSSDSEMKMLEDFKSSFSNSKAKQK